MDECLDVVVQGWSLQMVWRGQCLLLVELYILVQVLTVDQHKSQLRDHLVERVG